MSVFANETNARLEGIRPRALFDMVESNFSTEETIAEVQQVMPQRDQK